MPRPATRLTPATAKPVASLFRFCRLESDTIGEPTPLQDLRLAAAASLEFVLREMIASNTDAGDYAAVTPELRDEGMRISRVLKPHNAPDIYRHARLTSDGRSIRIVFADDLQLVLLPDRVDVLKRFAESYWELDRKADWADVGVFLERDLLARLQDEAVYTYDE